MGVEKERGESRKAAVITLHRWLPNQSTQMAAVRAWGIPYLEGHDEQDISAIWVDDVRKVGRTTNWPKHLTERAELFMALKKFREPPTRVFFMNPLCVGFTEKLAATAIEHIFDFGHELYVHSMDDVGGAVFQAGDDMSDLFDQLGRNIKAAQMRDTRRRSGPK